MTVEREGIGSGAQPGGEAPSAPRSIYTDREGEMHELNELWGLIQTYAASYQQGLLDELQRDGDAVDRALKRILFRHSPPLEPAVVITSADGHMRMEWPPGQDATTISRELLEGILDQLNELNDLKKERAR